MNALNELPHKMAIKNEATIAALTRVLSGSKDILKPEIQALGEWCIFWLNLNTHSAPI